MKNGDLKKVGSVIRTANGYVANPTAKDYASIGAYPRDEASFSPPTVDEGYHAVSDGYALKDGKWVRKWRVEPITYNVDDYDAAMEDYLRSVRSERGYTTLWLVHSAVGARRKGLGRVPRCRDDLCARSYQHLHRNRQRAKPERI